MTLHQITSAIKAANGEVIFLSPSSFGFIVRAMMGNVSCRIIILPDGHSLGNIPAEPSSQTHLISDIQGLQDWLESLQKLQCESNAQPFRRYIRPTLPPLIRHPIAKMATPDLPWLQLTVNKGEEVKT